MLPQLRHSLINAWRTTGSMLALPETYREDTGTFGRVTRAFPPPTLITRPAGPRHGVPATGTVGPKVIQTR